MKEVFLIHAHKDLDQLNALVAQLCDDDFLIYVHLDLKWQVDPAQVHPAAHLVSPRMDVRWAHFSQVEATLNSLRQIVREVPDFDKVIFLSAQDYPLLPNARLKQELAELADLELLDAVPMREGEGAWAANFRYQYFYSEAGNALTRFACSIANRLLRLFGTTRRLPCGMEPWAGSSWWALSQCCIVHLLDRLAREPGVLRFYRSTQCPDEMFFQTLIMNSPHRERVLGRNFRHIQWPEQGAPNPKILDEHDFERIAKASDHFCRKLDSAASVRLVPRLQALLAERAQQA